MLPPSQHSSFPGLFPNKHCSSLCSWKWLHKVKFESHDWTRLLFVEHCVRTFAPLISRPHQVLKDDSKAPFRLLLLHLRMHVLCADGALGWSWQPMPQTSSCSLLVAGCKHHPFLLHCQLWLGNLGCIPLQSCWCQRRAYQIGRERILGREASHGEALHVDSWSRKWAHAPLERCKCATAISLETDARQRSESLLDASSLRSHYVAIQCCPDIKTKHFDHAAATADSVAIDDALGTLVEPYDDPTATCHDAITVAYANAGRSSSLARQPTHLDDAIATSWAAWLIKSGFFWCSAKIIK